MPTRCSKCSVDLAIVDWSGRPDVPHLNSAVKIHEKYFCSVCSITANDDLISEDALRILAERGTIESIIVTTTPSLDGYRIAKVVDVISAECVFGMNIFKDFFTGLTDFFGGRSETSQKVLREAREKCIHELRAEAHRIGANAVIGVDLDYSEFSGQGKSMLFLVASGTAVVLEKIESATNLS